MKIFSGHIVIIEKKTGKYINSTSNICDEDENSFPDFKDDLMVGAQDMASHAGFHPKDCKFIKHFQQNAVGVVLSIV